MLKRALETIPRRSSRECPFHFCLQPSRSRTTSWEHLTFAHLPVHPPTPHAHASLSHHGKDLSPPTSLHQLST
ncbi:hypothetical protein CHARACLAT_024175 [Characodon lateralis]|uniref:Uncharacterized protein n=1 Tax=Characodon lateralis TaxID=208331 RepID=A0ABU7EQ91_9TELE|nr:hypothetical protein [Characodon lateralis]